MSKQIQIRNDLYERMVKAKKLLSDRAKLCNETDKPVKYSESASFSDVLDWLFSESEYL